MTSFQDHRITRLSKYKTTSLTKEPGYWRGMQYDHILPAGQIEKNIFEEFRDEFWIYHKGTNIKLHQFFHHLNSSQALCFNLFFPLFHYDKKLLTYVLHRIINVAPVYDTSDKSTDKYEESFILNNAFKSCEFEKILETSEATNFDFYVHLQKEHRVLFEIKYTESEFGKTSADKTHIHKYNTIYRERLERLLRPEFLNQDFVFRNYQVIRNLSYINDLTTVVFLFPEANKELKGTESLINKILYQNMCCRQRWSILKT